MQNQQIIVQSPEKQGALDNLKAEIAKSHYKTIVNFMQWEDNANRFMSSLLYVAQKTPKLLECTQESLITAFMNCAELGMYPSSVSGECYILPYEKKEKVWNKWVTKYVEAQFQLWYQWIITLLYGSGIQSIRSEIVRKNDTFRYVNWEVYHEIDIFKKQSERGEPVWCYVIVKLNGTEITKMMTKDEILAFKEFSKSKGSNYSPWNSDNDPELHMWRKTVIKQIAKVLPKTDRFTSAIEKDNKESPYNGQAYIEKPATDEDKKLWSDALDEMIAKREQEKHEQAE